MATSDSLQINALLVVEIGATITRAFLFGLAEERYRLLGSGQTPTTLGAFGRDVRHGIRQAIEELQAITGRILLDPQKRLIQPIDRSGNGVDRCLVTVSAGPPLNLLLAGLHKEASLESAYRLARTTYAGAARLIDLSANPNPEEIIDDILDNRPDAILISGGFDNGASRSVLRLLEPIRMAFLRFPEELQPEILFAGNQVLHPLVKALFNHSPHLHLAPNIRPSLNQENLDAARDVLAGVTVLARLRQLPGLKSFCEETRSEVLPAAHAFSRVNHYFEQVFRSQKGVLGVDIEPAGMSLSAVFQGKLTQVVYPGPALVEALPVNELASSISEWLAASGIPDVRVKEYLLNQTLYPLALPVTETDLGIRYAQCRAALQCLLADVERDFPGAIRYLEKGKLSWVEPILVAGSLIAGLPNLSQVCLSLLDGLQPNGITTLLLDPNQVAIAIGALAGFHPLMATQVLDSDVFIHLATIIAPVGAAPAGTPVLRVRTSFDEGHEKLMDIRQGDLEVIPLPVGQRASLQLQPFHRYDIGMGGAGRSGNLRVTGSSLGIIIDARGRPLSLPESVERRAEIYRKWLWMLGG
ncbi:MAG: glutamate mutase L [Anaerolineales bacterium]|nr:glutamate mutase L [Anaerolineales bacterium]